jgi:hypothetical protein
MFLRFDSGACFAALLGDEGVVSVIDCMPRVAKKQHLVRIAVGKRGKVPLRMQLVLRPDYGSIVPWVHRKRHFRTCRF